MDPRVKPAGDTKGRVKPGGRQGRVKPADDIKGRVKPAGGKKRVHYALFGGGHWRRRRALLQGSCRGSLSTAACAGIPALQRADVRRVLRAGVRSSAASPKPRWDPLASGPTKPLGWPVDHAPPRKDHAGRTNEVTSPLQGGVARPLHPAPVHHPTSTGAPNSHGCTRTSTTYTMTPTIKGRNVTGSLWARHFANGQKLVVRRVSFHAADRPRHRGDRSAAARRSRTAQARRTG